MPDCTKPRVQPLSHFEGILPFDGRDMMFAFPGHDDVVLDPQPGRHFMGLLDLLFARLWQPGCFS